MKYAVETYWEEDRHGRLFDEEDAMGGSKKAVVLTQSDIREVARETGNSEALVIEAHVHLTGQLPAPDPPALDSLFGDETPAPDAGDPRRWGGK